jgi:hypothetical protein
MYFNDIYIALYDNSDNEELKKLAREELVSMSNEEWNDWIEFKNRPAKVLQLA